MEDFLLNNGFSWTWSKVTPYLLMVVIGVGLFLFLRKKIHRRNYRNLVSVVVLIPVAIYFAFNPIYEGDFSDNYTIIELNKSTELESGRLTVIAIAGCPYCYESIDLLKRIKNRTNCDEIDFIVYTKDSLNVQWYKEKGGEQINVKMQSEETELFKNAQGKFPTFVLDNSKETRAWSNNGFGVLARDWVESNLE